MRKVIGVDFSGGDQDHTRGNTWVAVGQSDGYTLAIDDSFAISRNELVGLLKKQPKDSVVDLDFPFSVPKSFMEFWRKKYPDNFDANPSRMHDVWAAAHKWGEKNTTDWKECDKNVSNPSGRRICTTSPVNLRWTRK